MARPTGYEPLNTPKPVADDLWIVDGPAIRFYGMPFSTRATIVRLSGGGLWVHSPTALDAGLAEAVAALGLVRHLVAPNWIHYAHVRDWQARFPEALAWAAPGVAKRAESRGMAIRFDRDLGQDAPADWAGEIDQMIVRGSKIHREAVFSHRVSRTLILTDLIENFEADKLGFWMRLITRIGGMQAPNGRMPPDMRASFRDRAVLREDLARMIAWQPDRVILSHGACIEADAELALRRAFRGLV